MVAGGAAADRRRRARGLSARRRYRSPLRRCPEARSRGSLAKADAVPFPASMLDLSIEGLLLDLAAAPFRPGGRGALGYICSPRLRAARTSADRCERRIMCALCAQTARRYRSASGSFPSGSTRKSQPSTEPGPAARAAAVPTTGSSWDQRVNAPIWPFVLWSIAPSRARDLRATVRTVMARVTLSQPVTTTREGPCIVAYVLGRGSRGRDPPRRWQMPEHAAQ